ncbi:MAG: hypothetical protein AB7K09_23585 [Planctomycetota bacterium]
MKDEIALSIELYFKNRRGLHADQPSQYCAELVDQDGRTYVGLQGRQCRPMAVFDVTNWFHIVEIEDPEDWPDQFRGEDNDGE